MEADADDGAMLPVGAVETRSASKRKKQTKYVPQKRGRGRPRKKTGLDVKLMHIIPRATPKYELARRDGEKTKVIKATLLEWLGDVYLNTRNKKLKRVYHRRVRDAIREYRKRMECAEAVREMTKTPHIVKDMVKWRQGMDASVVIRKTPKSDVGKNNPVRWNIHGNYFNGCTALDENLCCITLFPGASRYIWERLRESSLLSVMMDLPKQRKRGSKASFSKYFETKSFFGDGRMEWVAHGIKSQNDKASDITFVVPTKEDSFLMLLELLGEAGMDIALHSIARRYQKQELAVTHAYFYIVKNCWDTHKHIDFNEGGGNTFNVLVPIHLPEKYPQHLVVWDYAANRSKVKGSASLSGNYMYQLDEAIVVGESAFHATGLGNYRRLMLGFCVQQLPRLHNVGNSVGDHGWMHKDAFPNPKRNWSYIKRNRGAHYNDDDPTCCLHKKKTERGIYTFNY